MGLVSTQSEFLSDVASLIQKANELGFEVTGGELLRTKEQQEIYVNTDKSKTMNSNHLKKLAIDLNFFKDGRWINGLSKEECKKILQSIGDFWESLRPGKNSWGGNWKSFFDAPHFERRKI